MKTAYKVPECTSTYVVLSNICTTSNENLTPPGGNKGEGDNVAPARKLYV